MLKIRKLNIRGFSHHLAIVLIVVAVGVGGTLWLVEEHADSCTNSVTGSLSGSTITGTKTGSCCPGSASASVSGSVSSGSGTFCGSGSVSSTPPPGLTASCSLAATTPIVRNTDYSAKYTIVNSNEQPIVADAVNLNMTSTTLDKVLYKTSGNIPNIIAAESGYSGTFGSFKDTQTTSQNVLITLAGTVYPSQGGGVPLTGTFSCATSGRLVGEISSSTMASSDWTLVKPDTVASDGKTYTNIVKLNPGHSSNPSEIANSKVNNFAIDDNGTGAQACITARAIESSSAGYQSTNFEVWYFNANRVLVHPTFNASYRKLCYDFYIPAFDGSVPTPSGKDVYLAFYMGDPGSTSFFVRGVTISLL